MKLRWHLATLYLLVGCVPDTSAPQEVAPQSGVSTTPSPEPVCDFALGCAADGRDRVATWCDGSTRVVETCDGRCVNGQCVADDEPPQCVDGAIGSFECVGDQLYGRTVCGALVHQARCAAGCITSDRGVGCRGTALDSDGDGSPDAEDCAPHSPAVHPGALEYCGDGIDNNCSGDESDAVLGLTQYCEDRDGDDFGSADRRQSFCGEAPPGFSARCDDFDDDDADAHPGAAELPDGADNDGDGLIDEGLPWIRLLTYGDDPRDGCHPDEVDGVAGVDLREEVLLVPGRVVNFGIQDQFAYIVVEPLAPARLALERGVAVVLNLHDDEDGSVNGGRGTRRLPVRSERHGRDLNRVCFESAAGRGPGPGPWANEVASVSLTVTD